MRIGELSAELETAKPLNGKGAGLPSGGKTKAEVLRRAGISTSAAQRAEQMAAHATSVETARKCTAKPLRAQGAVQREPAALQLHSRSPERLPIARPVLPSLAAREQRQRREAQLAADRTAAHAAALASRIRAQCAMSSASARPWCFASVKSAVG